MTSRMFLFALTFWVLIEIASVRWVPSPTSISPSSGIGVPVRLLSWVSRQRSLDMTRRKHVPKNDGETSICMPNTLDSWLLAGPSLVVGTSDGRLTDSLFGSVMNRRAVWVWGAERSKGLVRLPVLSSGIKGLVFCERGAKTSEAVLGMLPVDSQWSIVSWFMIIVSNVHLHITSSSRKKMTKNPNLLPECAWRFQTFEFVEIWNSDDRPGLTVTWRGKVQRGRWRGECGLRIFRNPLNPQPVRARNMEQRRE